MSDPKLKGAVVGCRGMGSWHARSIARSHEVELVGVQPDEGRIELRVVS